ncbi:MAG: molybdate-binding protein [Acidimicrobiia bacterium]|nr:MAG: molybdate-binding protein [Acidimicrobiia bacterium]
MTVFAAASLTDAFTALERRFEATHAGIDVTLNFAGSAELAAQIADGAPADVYAPADEANMARLVRAGAVDGAPAVFARNRLAVAVERGNPLGIRGLQDLARREVTVVTCASQVPCGAYADQALAKAGVRLAPASREDSVKAALAKVRLGEADAAIVYATDVTRRAAGRDAEVEGVEIPDDENVVATLPIAVLKDTSDRAAAQEWVRFVTSPEARAILVDEYGFLAP